MLPEEITGDAPSPVVHGFGPLDACPSCFGGDFLVEEQAGGLVVFDCLGCHARWRYDLGYVWRLPT